MLVLKFHGLKKPNEIEELIWEYTKKVFTCGMNAIAFFIISNLSFFAIRHIPFFFFLSLLAGIDSRFRLVFL
jgi:hypothetical protein